jgi:hypothetical protein
MMADAQSVFIYLGMAFLSFVIAKYAEMANSKKAVWLIVILFSVIAGLRAISVGIDTKTYNLVFNIISDGTVRAMYGIEESFIRICAVLLRVWNNNQFLLFIFALVSHGLILFRLWKDREFISFRWSVFAYYIMFYAFSLNGMRQFVAVAIIVYATSFVKEGKYIKFILSVIVATLFHTSAIIGLLYIFFEIIFSKYFDAKRKRMLYLFVFFGSILSLYLFFNLINVYSKYFDSFGIGRIISFGFIIDFFRNYYFL